MKNIIFTISLLSFSLFCTNLSFGQVSSKINIGLKIKLDRLEAAGQSETMLQVLARGDLDAIQSTVRAAGGAYKHGLNDIASISVPASGVSTLMADPAIKRVEYFEVEMKMLSDSMRENCNLDSLHQGFGNLPGEVQGEGVVVGIIDSGLEWDHPDFKNADGSTRVKYLWDQLITTTNVPQYGFGYEWDENDINAGNISHDPYSNGYGHGTGSTAIACGNGRAVPGKYMGAAPKSDIVSVALNYGNFYSNFVDGLNYIFDKADELEQPCVVNSSVGSYRGAHDTRDLASQMVESMLDEKAGRVLVQAAGNGGEIPMHLGYEVTQDTVFSWFKKGVAHTHAFFDLFADQGDFQNVYFSIKGRDRNDYNLLGTSKFYNISTDFPAIPFAGMDQVYDTLYYDGTSDVLAVLKITAELYQGTYDMFFEVFPSNNLDYWELATTGNGYFDVWSNSTLMGTSSILTPNLLPTVAELPEMVKYMHADTSMTIVHSWNCSDKVISVGNYSNMSSWTCYDGNTYDHTTLRGRKISVSSIGPTRTGLLKPDITASGDFTFGAQVLERLDELATFPTSNRLAPEGWHVRWSGTSIAAPVVTGTVACFLELFPEATYAEVKEAMISTAKVDQFVTDPFGPAPNNSWGYGKLDGFRFVNDYIVYGCTNPNAPNYDPAATLDDDSCLSVGTEDFMRNNFRLYSSPNPFNATTQIYYELKNTAFRNIEIRITDVSGKEIDRFVSDKNVHSFSIHGENFQSGLYFYSLIVDGQTWKTEKLVKN